MPRLETALLVAAVVLAAAVTPAASQAFDTELLANPGFESGSSGWTGATGWTFTTAVGNGVPRSGTLFVKASNGAGTGTGNEVATYQDIDVSAHALEIDAGRVRVSGSAYIRTWDGIAHEFGRVVLNYRDEGAASVISSSATSWTFGASYTLATAASSVTLPAGTRSIRYGIRAYRPDGGSTDTYFDDTSMTLSLVSTPTCAAEGDWPETTSGTTAAVPCTGEQGGDRTRVCRASGLWEPDESDAACFACAGATTEVPLLDADASGIDGDKLEAVFTSATHHYTAPVAWKFVGATTAYCDNDGSDSATWTHVADQCVTTHTTSLVLTQALKECGFSAAPEDGDTVWFYEAVVEATTQEAGEDVFGQPTTVTKTTAFRVRVELPKSVDVSASAVAYGNVIQFALLSQQEVDTSTPTAAFKWTLVTSVQYPYELTAKEVTEESAHDFESLGLSLSAASVACPASGACTQTFEITATESTSCELTDAELKSVFTIGCRSQFTGACDTPEGVETDTATFTVSTDSFCARVVEVATVTPTLTTSTSQGGASAADFVLQTTLFGRVTFAIEAGLSVTGTRLLSLDLVSEESVKPVTGAGTQDSAVVSAISFLESDQAGTAPHLDFQFQLNTDSVKFAVGGGQASLTITAVVEVTYDGVGSQRLEVSTEAVSGPGSVSTAASSTVGISTPAAGGSSSTAGSTVLGVSTGTAMVAGVGLVAVVALAAGAVVAARKRRSSQQPPKAVRHSSSSASIQLDITPAGAATTPAIATGDLANVQAAYDASQ